MGTRIVVMKDGVVQQVDTPTNLYQKPVNMFVGGFIGSPQMNFVEGKLVKKDNSVYFEFDSESIKLPDGKTSAKEVQDYIGKEVVLGIRPEDIHDDEAWVSQNSGNTVNAFVEVTEMMGAETYLYLQIVGQQFVARVNQRSTTKMNDTLKVAFDVNKVHLFDKETEVAIMH